MGNVIKLDMETPAVQYLCKRDKWLAKVISMVGAISYTPHDKSDTYSFLVHKVIEQMLSDRGGDLDFGKMHEMTDEEVLYELTKLHGIGNWTAKMYLIFVLDRPDVLPYEDIAFLQGYKWVYKTDDVSSESIKKKWAQCKTLWDFGFRTYDARLKSMIFKNRYSSSATP